MHIAITFRHLDSSEAIKDYAHEKVGKIQKFLRKPMKANVTLSVEKGAQIAEVQVNAGSEHYTAREHGDNIYASIDRVVDKITHQVHGAKGARLASTRGSMSAGEFARSSSAPPLPPDDVETSAAAAEE
jgi:putative sigma-54 modulation protein